MKTLYLQCNMGAAGDMLTAALLELLPDPDAFVEKLNDLGLDGVQIEKERVTKCGIEGTHMRVTVFDEEETSDDVDILNGPTRPVEEQEHHHHHHHHHHHDGDEEHHHGEDGHHHHDEDGHHHHHHHHHHHDHGSTEHSAEPAQESEHVHEHSSMADIEEILQDLDIPEEVRADVRAVYALIAEAESNAHGVPVTEIHFHEVGAMDAVADITAVCLLMHELAPDQVIVSPVHVGSGQVKCAHGILPVPAPATAYILRDAPIYSGTVQGELCTPTGAALLKHFATRFGAMPPMRVSAVGYGMGMKDFEAANCVRAMLGQSEETPEMILELACNLDDMTPEEIGFAMDRLLEGGALDVFTIPIGMKKSRPGVLLTVLCREEKKDALVSLLFAHTSTLGVRQNRCDRYELSRRSEDVETPYGTIRRKIASGYGVERAKYEYEDLARAARENGVSIAKIKKELK